MMGIKMTKRRILVYAQFPSDLFSRNIFLSEFGNQRHSHGKR
jgi:hypothetical protein